MPRVRLQDVQDFHDEVTNDGRRPIRIKRAAGWDDKPQNKRVRRGPTKSREGYTR